MVHQLTTEQIRKIVDAIGDGSDFPKATDDPKVNHVIDCVMADEGDELPYEPFYVEEVQTSKRLQRLEKRFMAEGW